MAIVDELTMRGGSITTADQIKYDDETFIKEVLDGKQDKLTYDNVPTPSSQKIVRSGDLFSALEARKINYLPRIVRSRTINGITFDISDDGTITANGTATAHAIIDIPNVYIPGVGQYMLTGCEESSNYGIDLYKGYRQNSRRVATTRHGLDLMQEQPEFPIFFLDPGYYVLTVIVHNGTTVENLVFQPMLQQRGYGDLYVPGYYEDSGYVTLSDRSPSEYGNIGIWYHIRNGVVHGNFYGDHMKATGFDSVTPIFKASTAGWTQVGDFVLPKPEDSHFFFGRAGGNESVMFAAYINSDDGHLRTCSITTTAIAPGANQAAAHFRSSFMYQTKLSQ